MFEPELIASYVYNSNRLDGITLSEADTNRILAEDVDPEEGQFGDDDNWDRVVPGDPAAGGPGNSSGETRTTVTPDAREKEHARPSFSFRVRVRLIFRTWIIIVGAPSFWPISIIRRESLRLIATLPCWE